MIKVKRKRIELDQSQIDSYDEFLREFKGESDRAAVILGTSKLEYLLYQILSKHLLPNTSSQDDLLEGDNPLSTFSARINVCFRLGIIDPDFTRSLHLIRKIRNTFAHEFADTKLDFSPHRDRIRDLVSSIADTDFFTDVKQLYFADKAGPSADFFAAIAVMVARLETICVKIKPVTSANAYRIVPANYTSLFRTGREVTSGKKRRKK